MDLFCEAFEQHGILDQRCDRGCHDDPDHQRDQDCEKGRRQLQRQQELTVIQQQRVVDHTGSETGQEHGQVPPPRFDQDPPSAAIDGL